MSTSPPDSETRPRPWILQNGKGEWLRWFVAMGVGAVVVWVGLQVRIGVLEVQVQNIAATLSAVQTDLRELRTSLFEVVRR